MTSQGEYCFDIFRTTSHNNLDESPFRDFLKALGDVGVPHTHATVAGWSAKQRFLVRAVNIDKAVLCIRIGRVEASQPKYACENEVLLTALGRDFTCGRAALEHRADCGAGADFLAYDEASERSPVASVFKAQPKLRSRYRVGLADLAIAEHLKNLTCGIDAKLHWNVDIFGRDVTHYVLSLCPDNIELQSLAQLAP